MNSERTGQRKQTSRQWLKNSVRLLLLPVILPLAVVALGLFFLYRITLYLLIWTLWLPRGKDILLVYSDSPIWHGYMASEVLPLVQERAVVLNWSQRNSWQKWSLGVAVFRHFGGRREFNPLVILFPPVRSARIFRFWPAFKDWKHGDREPVKCLRRELLAAL